MRIDIYCAMCGVGKTIDINLQKVKMETPAWKILKPARWVLQQNGDNFDMYCSKRCAQ